MVKAKDQFGISGINRGNTRIALGDDDDVFQKMIDAMDKKFGPVEGTVFPGVTEDDPYKYSQGHDTSDASKSKVYSDMNVPSLGAKDGSLVAMANTENRGIVTAAPETKRMAGFFSPKNFQKSGSPDATIMTREQMRQALTGDPGYSRFGTRDAATTQSAKDTAAFKELEKYVAEFAA